MAPVLASGQKPQTKYEGSAFGLELGSAAADCFSWAAPQVGRNSTSISPFTFSLCGFHSDVCDVLSLGIEMPSSGGQFWGWCPSCKNSGAAAAQDVSETPRFQLWGCCPCLGLAPGCSSAPLQREAWCSFLGSARDHTRLGVGPGMWNTRDTPPLPERIGWVATPKNHDLGHHATLGCATTRPPWNSRKRTLKDVIDVCDREEHTAVERAGSLRQFRE